MQDALPCSMTEKQFEKLAAFVEATAHNLALQATSHNSVIMDSAERNYVHHKEQARLAFVGNSGS